MVVLIWTSEQHGACVSEPSLRTTYLPRFIHRPSRTSSILHFHEVLAPVTPALVCLGIEGLAPLDRGMNGGHGETVVKAGVLDSRRTIKGFATHPCHAATIHIHLSHVNRLQGDYRCFMTD